MKKQTKIALVGPIAPYRSGISLYSTKLYEALNDRNDTFALSYYRQYPKFLYPGKNELVKISEAGKMPGVEYVLDYSNPISLHIAARKIVENGCGVAIINWWTLFWQPMFVYLAKLLRRKGVKIIFLCHNVTDHDKKWSLKGASEWLLKSADGYIVHSKEEKKLLGKMVPDAPVLQRNHPIYNHYPAPNKKMPKRGRLEILFFGYIRPYKGLDILVDALAGLQDKDVYLSIVGEAWEDEEKLKKRLEDSGAPNLEFVLEYVDDQAAANYFDRADIIALPYTSATGSGVATLAYHYKKPVLATRVGGLKDTVIEKKTGWLVEPDSASSLAFAISKIERPEIKKMKSKITEYCQENSWGRMADEIYKFASKIT